MNKIVELLINVDELEFEGLGFLELDASHLTLYLLFLRKLNSYKKSLGNSNPNEGDKENLIRLQDIGLDYYKPFQSGKLYTFWRDRCFRINTFKKVSKNEIPNELKDTPFAHLHNHSKFTILQSTSEVQKLVEKALDFLKKKNYVYEGILEKPKGNEVDDWEPRKQILFQSTKFGDDADRALKKSDGSWTYFANDVAYHLNKIERKFDLLINVLGADHAGYLKRQASCVSALSENKQQIISKVCQLVKLFKSGSQLKMSKRAGDFITASDLIKEVGKDSVRFMMIYRSNDSQLDFDFDSVTDHSKENPVFYVQYAHARICSLFRKNKYEISNEKKLNLYLLNQEIEIDIIKKIAEWPKCLELSAHHLEPHRVPFYLYELASLFHTYWNSGNENDNLKILNDNQPELQSVRLFIIKKMQLVLKSGLDILNVTAPVEM